MAPKKKTDGSKKKKPSTFVEFWNRLLRKDRKKKGAVGTSGASTSATTEGVPTEKTVQRAVDKVAKILHMKKQERQQVTHVLAAELQQRAVEKKQAHQRATAAKQAPVDGATVYPVQIQTGLFEHQEAEAAPAPEPTPETEASPEEEPSVVALNHPLPKMEASDLEMQRKKFLQRAGGSGKSVSSSGKSQSSGRGSSFGSQPDSITLDRSAVLEIKKHMLINMLRDVLVDASVRQQPPSPNQKRPEDMNVDELIQLRKTNMNEWEALVKENTVVSYALSKPNEKELKKAKEKKEHGMPKRKPLQFDDKVEVANVPVGKDFNPNEKKNVTSDSIKRK